MWREASDTAVRLRWLSESPTSWDPRWNRPSTPTGKRLQALLAVLETPLVRLEEVVDALCGLPLVLQLVLRHGGLLDSRTCDPATVLSVSLVSVSCAAYVGKHLRSGAADKLWARLACGMVREGAVLHPELVARGTLREWLNLERWVGPSPRPLGKRLPPKFWLQAQRWAELFAHFCNVSNDQCQWSGWMRLEIVPYVEADGRPVDIGNGMGEIEFGSRLVSSLTDFLVLHDPSRVTSLGRTVSTLLEQFTGMHPGSQGCLFELMRLFAPLFPQKCDFDAASGWVDSDDIASDEEEEERRQRILDTRGEPVPCRWVDEGARARLPAAEAAKVNSVWSKFPEQEFPFEERADALVQLNDETI
jgi:hypothetical protein